MVLSLLDRTPVDDPSWGEFSCSKQAESRVVSSNTQFSCRGNHRDGGGVTNCFWLFGVPGIPSCSLLITGCPIPSFIFWCFVMLMWSIGFAMLRYTCEDVFHSAVGYTVNQRPQTWVRVRKCSNLRTAARTQSCKALTPMTVDCGASLILVISRRLNLC